jgi:hypothetical protein
MTGSGEMGYRREVAPACGGDNLGSAAQLQLKMTRCGKRGNLDRKQQADVRSSCAKKKIMSFPVRFNSSFIEMRIVSVYDRGGLTIRWY